jgi:hypothetical protein
MGRHSDAVSYQRSKDMWGFENQLGNVEQVLRDGNAEKLYRSIAIEQTDQRLQTDGKMPAAINQTGQQTSLQKVPQGQLLKLKWSTEKLDTCSVGGAV